MTALRREIQQLKVHTSLFSFPRFKAQRGCLSFWKFSVSLNPPGLNLHGYDHVEQDELNHLKCHSLSALPQMEGDNSNAGVLSATHGIISSNLHHKVIQRVYCSCAIV